MRGLCGSSVVATDAKTQDRSNACAWDWEEQLRHMSRRAISTGRGDALSQADHAMQVLCIPPPPPPPLSASSLFTVPDSDTLEV